MCINWCGKKSLYLNLIWRVPSVSRIRLACLSSMRNAVSWSKMSKLTILIIFVGSALPAPLVINCTNLFCAYNGHLSSTHPRPMIFALTS